MDFDSSCAVRACIFNRVRTVLDWLCRMFKELNPTEPAYTLTWILTGILHIPWALYTLAWQPAVSCWLNLLTSTRPTLLFLWRKICGSPCHWRLCSALGVQLTIPSEVGHSFCSLTICHKRICKSEGCTVKTEHNQCLLEHLIMIKRLFFLLSCCCLQK